MQSDKIGKICWQPWSESLPELNWVCRVRARVSEVIDDLEIQGQGTIGIVFDFHVHV